MKALKSILYISGCFSLLACVAIASADTLTLATGLDSNGKLQTAGDLLDANWQITGGNTTKQGATAGQAFTVASGNADWYGGWETNGPNSSWIAQNPDSNNNGLLIATRTFTLTQAEINTASFSGLGVSLDDSGQVVLNNHVEISGLAYQNAGSLTPLTISNSDLVAGVNILQIQITGTDNNLEAMRMEGTLTYQSVPEPAPWLALAGSIGAILIKRRLS